jgi:subtilisin family serine protease
MRYPGAYAPVISAAATGPVGQFPLDDPTTVQWILGDVPEAIEAAHYIAPFSAWELAGQDLDVAAPGYPVPVVWANQQGQLDYSFFWGTSAATPHVAGIAALLLQKNPNLTAAEVESILETTAMPLLTGCRDVIEGGVGPGNEPTWSDHGNVYFFETTYCWEANAVGAGLVDAEAALAATPWP